MKVVGFAGYSGAGKTQLLVQIIAQLRQKGLRVSAIKHAHHQFDIDHPGKDSYRYRQAGAFEVVVASRRRLALVREYERETELTVHQMIGELSGHVDWVMVEGYKHSDLPKIEVWRATTGQAARYMDDERILALTTDLPAALLPAPPRCPVLDLNDPPAIAQWLLDNRHRFAYPPLRQP
ncbi:MAG: molybdopterin-guanine dinucleotide biosynthesis protein B [Burkholderiaceae bacterium]|jgi:molybdopterin-guanine dinucleotide biosynthesis protein B|nr:molybdopterin-guanine dinucleotide biosynthesis protein B [Burkholderiaceae bacterium]